MQFKVLLIMEFLILGLFSIPQIILIGYLLISLLRSIEEVKPSANEINKWLALELFILIVCPLLGVWINGTSTPAGDLNPGSDMEFYPAALLQAILWVFVPSILSYFMSKILLFKYQQVLAAQALFVSAVSIFVISLIPLLFIVLSGFILVSLFPFLGLLIIAPLFSVLLAIYTIKSVKILFSEHFQLKDQLVLCIAGVMPTAIAFFWFNLTKPHFSSSLTQLIQKLPFNF